MTRPRFLCELCDAVLLRALADRLRELRDAPRDVPAGVDQLLLVALRMLEDPQAAVGKLALIRRAQRADRVAFAAATAAEAADRDAAAASATAAAGVVDDGFAAGAGRAAVVCRVVVDRTRRRNRDWCQ